MAKFNREFLVPYLEDVCALYMADFEICTKIFGAQREILILQRGEKIEPPAEPEHEETMGCVSSFLGGLGILEMCLTILAAVTFILTPKNERGSMPVSFLIILVVVGFLIGLFLWKVFGEPERETRKYNKELDRQYEEALRQYQIERNKVLIGMRKRERRSLA